jgi:hypothetical protein
LSTPESRFIFGVARYSLHWKGPNDWDISSDPRTDFDRDEASYERGLKREQATPEERRRRKQKYRQNVGKAKELQRKKDDEPEGGAGPATLAGAQAFGGTATGQYGQASSGQRESGHDYGTQQTSGQARNALTLTQGNMQQLPRPQSPKIQQTAGQTKRTLTVTQGTIQQPPRSQGRKIQQTASQATNALMPTKAIMQQPLKSQVLQKQKTVNQVTNAHMPSKGTMQQPLKPQDPPKHQTARQATSALMPSKGIMQRPLKPHDPPKHQTARQATSALMPTKEIMQPSRLQGSIGSQVRSADPLQASSSHSIGGTTHQDGGLPQFHQLVISSDAPTNGAGKSLRGLHDSKVQSV